MSRSSFDHTDTPAFKNWFGASKVVNAKGLPLVMYHGSPSKDVITEFNANAQGNGRESSWGVFWFTPAKSYAKFYADKAGKGQGQILPVYIHAQHILSLDKVRGKYTPEAQRVVDGKPSNKSVIQHALDSGYDAVSIMNGNEIAVKDPTKIKSAIGNSGLYLRDSSSLTDHETALTLANAAAAKAHINGVFSCEVRSKVKKVKP